jgi:hypothetical protein
LEGEETIVKFLLAMLVGIAPVLTGNGIANEEEVDADSFAERVRTELGCNPVLVVSGPSLAVWAKRP